jgi:hypothetical protein
MMDVVSHHLLAALRHSRASKPSGRRQHTVHVMLMLMSNMVLREHTWIDRDQARISISAGATPLLGSEVQWNGKPG